MRLNAIFARKKLNVNTFHHHQTNEHAETVKKGKQIKCQYCDQGCWFLHDINSKNGEGILKEMEKFTIRIINLEIK